jgi:hypothetical protein
MDHPHCSAHDRLRCGDCRPYAAAPPCTDVQRRSIGTSPGKTPPSVSAQRRRRRRRGCALPLLRPLLLPHRHAPPPTLLHRDKSRENASQCVHSGTATAAAAGCCRSCCRCCRGSAAHPRPAALHRDKSRENTPFRESTAPPPPPPPLGAAAPAAAAAGAPPRTDVQRRSIGTSPGKTPPSAGA